MLEHSSNGRHDSVSGLIPVFSAYPKASPLAPAGTAASVVRGEGPGVRGSWIGSYSPVSGEELR